MLENQNLLSLTAQTLVTLRVLVSRAAFKGRIRSIFRHIIDDIFYSNERLKRQSHVTFIHAFVKSINCSMLKTLNLLKFPLKTFTQKLSFQATLMELIQQEKERTETSKAVVRNKYNGRDKKRSWEEDSEQPQPKRERSSTDESFERIKRKKSAILIGYCGKDYFGMQRNPGMNTIEEVGKKDIFSQRKVIFILSTRCSL